jgi:hypothetical protein
MFELPCDFSRVFARIAELHLVVMEQGGHKLYVVSFAPEKEGGHINLSWTSQASPHLQHVLAEFSGMVRLE